MLASSVWRGTERRWFLGGLFLGAGITATIAVLVGAVVRPLLPGPARVVAVVLLAAVVLPGELGAYRLRLPQAARQVRQWISEEGAGGALQFGVEMGTGFRTFSTSNLPHLALVALALNPEPAIGLAVAAGFATGRAMMTIGRAGSPDPEAWDADWAASERRILRLLAAAAAVALPHALGWAVGWAVGWAAWLPRLASGGG